jgi:hypothetical protein
MLYNMIGVDLRGQDAATVVIAVGIGDINLAETASPVLVMVTGVIAVPAVALT